MREANCDEFMSVAVAPHQVCVRSPLFLDARASLIPPRLPAATAPATTCSCPTCSKPLAPDACAYLAQAPTGSALPTSTTTPTASSSPKKPCAPKFCAKRTASPALCFVIIQYQHVICATPHLHHYSFVLTFRACIPPPPPSASSTLSQTATRTLNPVLPPQTAPSRRARA